MKNVSIHGLVSVRKFSEIGVNLMAGSVNKDNKTGKWFYILELGKDENGKRKQKKKRGFKTKREAQQALVAAENELINGTYVINPSNVKYREYSLEWYKTKKNTVGLHMQQLIQILLTKHILPKFGNMEISKISPIDIQSFINQLAEDGYSTETIIKIHNVVRNSLEHACDLGLIKSNSAIKIKLPKRAKKAKIEVWNKNEVNIFLRTAKDDRYFILFHLAITTGMRQGELLGLRWKDVDLEKGILKIAQTLSHDGKEFLEGAKTKSSIRTIPIPDTTKKMLNKHKISISKEKMELGSDYSDFDLVICTKLGTPLNPANVRRTFSRLIKLSGVKSIRFHDLRHTHATFLLSEGVNVKVISERLGHSNTKITLDTYSHILPTMQQDAINKLNDLII